MKYTYISIAKALQLQIIWGFFFGGGEEGVGKIRIS